MRHAQNPNEHSRENVTMRRVNREMDSDDTKADTKAFIIKASEDVVQFPYMNPSLIASVLNIEMSEAKLQNIYTQYIRTNLAKAEAKSQRQGLVQAEIASYAKALDPRLWSRE